MLNRSYEQRKNSLEIRVQPATMLKTCAYVENQAILESILVYPILNLDTNTSTKF